MPLSPAQQSAAERRAAQQAATNAYLAAQQAQQAAWAAAAPGTSQSRGTLPSAGEVARVMSQETQTAQYIIQQTGIIEECFAHILCWTGLIYVFASVSNGVLTSPSASVYIGRTRQHLTEERADTTPVLLNDSPTGEPQSCRTYVNGPAGTVVLLHYR